MHGDKPETNQSNFNQGKLPTCVLFFTDCVRTERGPVLNSSSSRLDNSSGVISDFGLFKSGALKNVKCKNLGYVHKYST
jgi:hypothetical protein